MRRVVSIGKILRRALVLSLTLGLGACDQGVFPGFLEPLDVVDPVTGDVAGWIEANEDSTQVVVLSDDGQYLRSIIYRDTSADVEVGKFSIDGDQLHWDGQARFSLPKETGSVNGRDGSHPIDPRPPGTTQVSLPEGRLLIEDWGEFSSTSSFVDHLDLTQSDGRGCLLRFVQLSIRTIQARIRNFGGAGTVIYHNNESSFAGFVQGEQRIVVKNLLSPDTTITYDDLVDFPEVLLEGAFVTHVNTSGDGWLEQGVNFTIRSSTGSPSVGEDDSSIEQGGASGQGSEGPSIVAEGRLIYGPDDPISIEQGDVVGGSYQLHFSQPLVQSEEYPWQFLEDLDMRACVD
jgi:hypothetical protein